jgi:PAS domain-containing protein
MVLVEAGLLCCDQLVAEFIPLFGRLRVADGAGRDVPARTPPTIQDLMRHTAGLSYGYQDLDGTVLSWNAGAERLKGYAESEILGQHFSKFFTPEERDVGKPAAAMKSRKSRSIVRWCPCVNCVRWDSPPKSGLHRAPR